MTPKEQTETLVTRFYEEGYYGTTHEHQIWLMTLLRYVQTCDVKVEVLKARIETLEARVRKLEG